MAGHGLSCGQKQGDKSSPLLFSLFLPLLALKATGVGNQTILGAIRPFWVSVPRPVASQMTWCWSPGQRRTRPAFFRWWLTSAHGPGCGSIARSQLPLALSLKQGLPSPLRASNILLSAYGPGGGRGLRLSRGEGKPCQCDTKQAAAGSLGIGSKAAIQEEVGSLPCC